MNGYEFAGLIIVVIVGLIYLGKWWIKSVTEYPEDFNEPLIPKIDNYNKSENKNNK